MTRRQPGCPVARLQALALAFGVLGLAACAPTSLSDLPPELQATSVVTSRGPGPPLAPSGRFAWGPDSRVLADPATYDVALLERVIQDALSSEMEQRGWMWTGGGGAEVQLGYVVSTDRELDDAELQRTFGMSPGLSTDGSRYGKGTLVVEVRRLGSPQALWRGSVQILADPTLPEALRRQRIDNGVAALMRTLPVE